MTTLLTSLCVSWCPGLRQPVGPSQRRLFKETHMFTVSKSWRQHTSRSFKCMHAWLRHVEGYGRGAPSQPRLDSPSCTASQTVGRVACKRLQEPDLKLYPLFLCLKTGATHLSRGDASKGRCSASSPTLAGSDAPRSPSPRSPRLARCLRGGCRGRLPKRRGGRGDPDVTPGHREQPLPLCRHPRRRHGRPRPGPGRLAGLPRRARKVGIERGMKLCVML